MVRTDLVLVFVKLVSFIASNLARAEDMKYDPTKTKYPGKKIISSVTGGETDSRSRLCGWVDGGVVVTC